MADYIKYGEVLKCGDFITNPHPYFKKLSPDVKLPTRAHYNDLGLDIYSNEDIELYSGDRKLVGTGLVGSIADGHGFFIKDKSGMALKGIETSGGVIEGSYRGEWKIILTNTNRLTLWQEIKQWFGWRPKPYIIKKGDKIAQCIIIKINLNNPIESEELSETIRGTGGFGSTGK
jgi:dUTP pyrophosphatase